MLDYVTQIQFRKCEHPVSGNSCMTRSDQFLDASSGTAAAIFYYSHVPTTPLSSLPKRLALDAPAKE